jgi:RNA polymerase sigma-70 factor, ECF subfamily
MAAGFPRLRRRRTEQDSQRLERLFSEHADSILAYCLRRDLPLDDAQEVVAETFLVAWRRLDEVPDPPLYWLLRVARNVMANVGRGGRRRDALRSRLKAAGETLARAPRDPADLVDERERVREALAHLPEWDREALSLMAWDGLTIAEASEVMGCGPKYFTKRISRARTRLVRQMARSGHLYRSGTVDIVREPEERPGREGV